MALVKLDLCLQTTTSSGTGDLLLDGTVAALRTFDQAITDTDLTSGDQIKYKITTPTQYEWGLALIEKVSTQVFLRRSTGTLLRSSTGSKLDVPGGGITQVYAAIPDVDQLTKEDRSSNGGTLAVTDNAQTFTGNQTVVGNQVTRSDDAGAAAGPLHQVNRNSASPAAADILGAVQYLGQNDAAEAVIYAQLHAVLGDPADGTEDGDFVIATMEGGTLAERLRIAGDGITTPGLTPQGANTINAEGGFYEDGVKLLPFSGAITFTLTTLEAVSAGDPVALTQDGDVRLADPFPATTVATDAAAFVLGCYLDTQNVHVIVYEDTTGDMRAKAGSMTALGAISYGSATALITAGTVQVNALVTDGASTFVAFNSSATAADADLVCCTASGTTITAGTPVVFDGSNVIDIQDAAHGDGAYVFVYRDTTNSRSYACAFTVAGTTPTFGTPVELTATAGDNLTVTYDAAAGKFLIGYEIASSSQFYLVIATLTGTAIALGTPTLIATDGGYADASMVYDAASGKHLHVTRDSTDLKAYVATISGTGVSVGTVISYDPSIFGGWNTVPRSLLVSPDTGTILAFGTTSNGTWRIGGEVQISGTTTVFARQIQFGDIGATDYPPFFDPDTGLVITLGLTGNTLAALPWQPGLQDGIGSDLRGAFIGCAQASALAAASVSIALKGSVDTNQSGMTPSLRQYLQSDGSVGETVTDYPIGFAVTATALKLD